MAGVKLSSPPLFQSTPNLSSSSPSLFCPPPNRTHPSRRPAPTQSLLDSASASAASSSTREGSHVGSSHKDEDAEGRKDGQDEMSKIAAEDNLEGVLSKYIWSEPSKASAISRLDRDKIVESIVTTKSSILDTLDQLRYKLSPSDFTSILKRFIQLKQWDQVGLVFDWMKANKKLRAQSVSVYIVLMAKAGQHNRALQSYRDITDPDIKLNKFVCNTLLKVLIGATLVEKAFKVFEDMKADGFLPDVYSYSIIITGCAKRKGAYMKAKKYMSEMLSKGLKADSFVYASVLHVYASSGMEEEARTLFEEMQADGIKPIKFHYASLLNMYAEKLKAVEAESLFQHYKKSGLPLDEVILNCLIKVYANSGNLEKARLIFTEMPSLDCPPGEVTYSVMIDSFCKAGQLEDARLLLDEMKTKGINPGNHAYSMLISAYSKLGKAETVETLSNEAITQMRGSLDSALFNSILKSYCTLGMRDAIMDTLKRMSQESVSPDRATFNILIFYFCQERMFDIALQTFYDLKYRKFRPNFNSYVPLIIGLAEAGRVNEAVKLYTQMKKAAIPPSEQIFAALIDALCKERRADEAFKFLKEIMYFNQRPSSNSLESILLLCGSHTKILEQILDGTMISQRSIVDQVNWTTLLSAYQKEGLHDAMLKLVDFIKSKGITIGSTHNVNDLAEKLKEVGQTKILGELSEIPLTTESVPL